MSGVETFPQATGVTGPILSLSIPESIPHNYPIRVVGSIETDSEIWRFDETGLSARTLTGSGSIGAPFITLPPGYLPETAKFSVLWNRPVSESLYAVFVDNLGATHTLESEYNSYSATLLVRDGIQFQEPNKFLFGKIQFWRDGASAPHFEHGVVRVDDLSMVAAQAERVQTVVIREGF
jgi:hypothetical protein